MPNSPFFDKLGIPLIKPAVEPLSYKGKESWQWAALALDTQSTPGQKKLFLENMRMARKKPDGF